MRRIAIIPARGGSKRIPRKNIKNFFGKPIIKYSIEAAIQSGLFDEIMVSTDDDEIAQIAIQYGANVPFMRSDINSNDFAITTSVIDEVLTNYRNNNINFDVFCCIYPAAPLITSEKLCEGYELLINGDFDSVFPVLKYNSPIQRAFIIDKNKIKMIHPENYNSRSQDLPKTFHDAGQFYWMRVDKLFEENKLFTNNTGYIELEEFEAQDIDNDFDWKSAEFKYKLQQETKENKKLNNKIILGTAQFGMKYGINNHHGKLHNKSIKNILDFAFENKIRLLDTAEAYGNSQEIIGEYHKLSDNKFNIITKFCSYRDDLPKTLGKRIEQNLKILDIDSLYGYMFHSFLDFKMYFDLYKKEINELKKSGIINRFGVSIYSNNEIEELLKHENIDLIQMPFNLLDNNTKRSKIIMKAKDKGIEIHTRSTFLQGLFFKNTKDFPEEIKPLEPYLNEINRISQSNNLKLNDVSLNYIFQQKKIDKILIGVDSVEQLKENILSLQKEIPEKVIKQIDVIDVKEIALLNPSNWN